MGRVVRALVAIGHGLVALAMLSWLPEFADPLLEGIVMMIGILGAILAATHWRLAGLGMLAACWAYFGYDFMAGGGGIDAVIAVLIAVGFVLAFVGAQRRSVAIEVGGLVLAGAVQLYWLLAYFGPENPYLFGNAIFTPGAFLAAVGAWRVGPLREPATPRAEPETVK